MRKKRDNFIVKKTSQSLLIIKSWEDKRFIAFLLIALFVSMFLIYLIVDNGKEWLNYEKFSFLTVSVTVLIGALILIYYSSAMVF